MKAHVSIVDPGSEEYAIVEEIGHQLKLGLLKPTKTYDKLIINPVDMFEGMNLVHSEAEISSSAKIGGFTNIKGFVSIGDHCHIGMACDIDEFVYIHDRVKIGSFSIIRNGSAILEDSVIPPMSELHDDSFACKDFIVDSRRGSRQPGILNLSDFEKTICKNLIEKLGHNVNDFVEHCWYSDNIITSLFGDEASKSEDIPAEFEIETLAFLNFYDLDMLDAFNIAGSLES